MPYLNKVLLIGNVGKDPETRVTPSGRKRVTFSLATSKRYRDNNGETKEETQWHNVVGWGKLPDIIEQLGVKKGTTLYVEGEVQYRAWDDQATGQKRYATDINMSTFQLLTPRQSAPNGTQAHARPNGNPATAPMPQADDEDDLPF
jgi:single-strand DNA-binding protein